MVHFYLHCYCIFYNILLDKIDLILEKKFIIYLYVEFKKKKNNVY